MGNPLTDGTWTCTWEHGRQLAAMSNGSTTWTYTYDANGMRTSRSNGTDTYSYVYNGSKLMQMKKGAYTLDFTYDGSGNPSTVTLNGATYYYITNLQGDVIEIRSASGGLVCYYAYDAWGNVVATTTSSTHAIVQLNPLRYRGYVYDSDTSLYYLQSRYYNPTIGRFVNADTYTSTGTGVLGNNMFAYCNNNPVNNYDSSGTSPVSYCNGDRNPLFIGYYGCGGGGGGGRIYRNLGSKKDANNILQREKDFFTNTDEQVVLESESIAFYYGIPVFKADFGDGGGLSFIVIFLDDDYIFNETGIKVLKHEYGHRKHMDDIGIVNYLFTTAIPSLIGAGLSRAGMIDVDYYSLPWEYVANMYGGVSHAGYTSWADQTGMYFWAYTILTSRLTGGI